MTKNIISLLLALTLGAAGAQTLPSAGQKIINQAQADFQFVDPTTGTQSTGTSQSNVVITTVTAVPSYTVTPNVGDPALTQTVNAGDRATFTYTLTNTGNTNLQMTLASVGDLPGTLSDTPVTLAPGATQQVTVTYTAPGDVRTGSYNQNLIVTADSDQDGDGTFEDTNIVDNDNNNVVNIYEVAEPPATSPALSPISFPSDPDNGNIAPVAGTPGTSTGPGYTADGPGDGTTDTPVNVDADGDQVAYPPADAGDNGPDIVTMTSGVTNRGPAADVLTIGPATDPDGTGPATVRLLNPATGQPFKTGDVVQDASGNTIEGVTTVVNADGTVRFVAGQPGTIPTPDANDRYPGIPAGTSPAYRVEITYPDSESQSTTGTIPEYTSTVPVTSQNANGQQVGSTDFTVKAPNPYLDITGTANVNPSTTAPVTADLPVTVTNNGQYTEAYDLTGTTTVPGGTVTYYLNGNPVTSVGPLAPGESVDIIARVTVPANTPASSYDLTSTATGQYSGAVAADTAPGGINVGIVTNPGTGITDPYNPAYTTNALFPVSKRVDVENVAPGGTIVYTITGTNRYNTSVYNVILRDPSVGGVVTNAFTYANLVNVTATGGTGAPVFSDCGANSSATLGNVLSAINAADAICISFPGGVAQDGTVSATLTFQVPQTPGQQR